MGTTPIYNFPYPDSTDLVRDGSQDFEDLADAVETTIDGLPSGGFTLLDSGSLNGLGSISVTGLPSTYKKLYLRANNLTANSVSDIQVRFNNVATAYRAIALRLSSTTVESASNNGALSSLRIDTSDPRSYFVCNIENLDVPPGEGRIAYTSTVFSTNFNLDRWTTGNKILNAVLESVQIVNVSGHAFSSGDYEVWGIE